MFLIHKSSVPEKSFQVLEQFNNQKIITNNNGYHLVSNVCPHQKSLISQKNGSGIRVCPYHSWSFDLNGNPISSGRTEYYCKNDKALESQTAYEWNSLLFSTAVDFNIPVSFDNMLLMEKRIDIVNADYKIIMDLFLDVDHIQGVHSGVYDLIGMTDTDVTWQYYKNGSIQSVQEHAYWIAVYPYTMIEWQKGSLFVTVARPSNGQTKVHVFKYMDKDFSTTWKLNESVWETAWAQDKAQAEIITAFTNHNLEPQKLHFREFLNGTN